MIIPPAAASSQQQPATQHRISSHSHIHGLGLDASLQPIAAADGMVGQAAARRAAGVVVRMLQQQKLAGRALLLAGSSGSGKTALAAGIAAELGCGTANGSVPFQEVAAAELASLHLSRTEALTQALRKAVAVCLSETLALVEGEVVAITVNRGSGLTPTAQLTLRTSEMEAIYEVGSNLIETLAREKVAPGDIISLEKATGKIERKGRSFRKARDFDAAAATTWLPTPEGELEKSCTRTHVVSLHELDCVNSSSSGGFAGFGALFSGATGEIGSSVRAAVDARIGQWREEGKCKLLPGLLFIDESHALDALAFSFLNRAIEGDSAPLVILASNRGGGLAGIPADFLDRLLVIKTLPYSQAEMQSILAARAEEEAVGCEQAAIERLAEIAAAAASLRYAMQLIGLADVCRQRRKAGLVTVADVDRIHALFNKQ